MIQGVSTAEKKRDFSTFIATLSERLRELIRPEVQTGEAPRFFGDRPHLLQRAGGESPLSVFIPKRFGGRGQRVEESLAVLEACSYESLPLSLVAGINGALFLQPLSKHGTAELQRRTFAKFLDEGALGGLMITEPAYGSDALNMRTSFEREAQGYRLQGTKHWGGLTGHADFWLLTGRGRTETGELERNISFFVWDRELGGMEVEEYYESLGLEMIPYGRSRIDTLLPDERRFEQRGSGVRMLLDLLHRSRLQFPGMAMGFLRRLMDEAIEHVGSRRVGGKALAGYDQVQSRLAEIQAAYTTCSAMCAHTTTLAGVQNDCSSEALAANTLKTVITDMMQSASQSLLQLVGAKGYRRDHIAGSAVVDSRPFQIFEGSNDILYEQIADSILKSMKRAKETSLSRFLTAYERSGRAMERLRGLFDFSPDPALPQRKKVDLGRILGRVMSMQMVLELGDRGYRSDLVENAVTTLRRQVSSLAGSFSAAGDAGVVEEYREDSNWLRFLPEGS